MAGRMAGSLAGTMAASAAAFSGLWASGGNQMVARVHPKFDVTQIWIWGLGTSRLP